MAKSTPMACCSFCNKPYNQVHKMISGPAGVHICDSCVEVCKAIVDRELAQADAASQQSGQLQSKHKRRFNLLKPKQIKSRLDEYVVGQDFAKRALAVAVYNHYKRLWAQETESIDVDDEFAGVAIEKSNILLLGSTGSGKTLLARTMAEMFRGSLCYCRCDYFNGSRLCR